MGDQGFVPGLRLSESFFDEVVRERADALLGTENYAAALMGPGSEVLSLDTEVSTDHDWGPRVVLVVAGTDIERPPSLRQGLPDSYRGYSLSFAEDLDRRPYTQPIWAVTLEDLFVRCVGFNPLRGISLTDWLSAPSNGLLMLTSGAVFHDGPGELTAAREALDWYPEDVWVWMLGCQWKRISQEHAFVARAAEVGDDVGARVIAARLARDAIRLAFLIERRYAPYSKWLGKALGWLSCGEELSGFLSVALSTADTAARQAALADAYRLLGEATNGLWPELGIDCSPRAYFDRASTIGPAADFATYLLTRTKDSHLQRLPAIGAADQVLDSTEADWPVARAMYRALLAPGSATA